MISMNVLPPKFMASIISGDRFVQPFCVLWRDFKFVCGHTMTALFTNACKDGNKPVSDISQQLFIIFPIVACLCTGYFQLHFSPSSFTLIINYK